MSIDRLIKSVTKSDIFSGSINPSIGGVEAEKIPINTTIGFACQDTGLPTVIAGAPDSIEKTRQIHEGHGDQVNIIKEECIRMLR